jgi:hypothetical protein
LTAAPDRAQASSLALKRLTLSFAAALVFGIYVCAVTAGASPGQRLLAAGDLAGLKPFPPVIVASPLGWVSATEGPSDITAEETWLKEVGFVAGAYEHLATAQISGLSALSFVAQFRTVAGARADVSHEVARLGAPPGWRVRDVFVGGVPNAYGVGASGPRGAVSIVFFARGHFSYGVFVSSPPATRHPSSAQVADAVSRLFQRIRRLPG